MFDTLYSPPARSREDLLAEIERLQAALANAQSEISRLKDDARYCRQDPPAPIGNLFGWGPFG
jgi:hypothetical protein